MSRIVKRHPVYVDRVELPDGSALTIADALAAGYVVEGTPAAAAIRAQEALDSRFDTILSLPEAAGKIHAARHLASLGTDPDLAARMLAGLPEDAAIGASAEPAPAPAPLDPRAARLAEIQAAGTSYRRARGRA